MNNYSLKPESRDGFPDSRKSYYLNKEFLNDLSDNEIESISAFLDKKLMKNWTMNWSRHVTNIFWN